MEPALWLIHPLVAGLSGPVNYHTQPGSRSALSRPRLEAGGFACHPLVKRGDNPWRERILIGRAPNNDVVLRDVSISKLHAWFEVDGGVFRLHDAQSVNGTWVDGQRLLADGPVIVRSGTQIRFGRMCCELLGSAALSGTLRGEVNR
jgi:pSer/pThr/pTyr-binding forkhead associated (FHA) protein